MKNLSVKLKLTLALMMSSLVFIQCDNDTGSKVPTEDSQAVTSSSSQAGQTAKTADTVSVSAQVSEDKKGFSLTNDAEDYLALIQCGDKSHFLDKATNSVDIQYGTACDEIHLELIVAGGKTYNCQDANAQADSNFTCSLADHDDLSVSRGNGLSRDVSGNINATSKASFTFSQISSSSKAVSGALDVYLKDLEEDIKLSSLSGLKAPTFKALAVRSVTNNSSDPNCSEAITSIDLLVQIDDHGASDTNNYVAEDKISLQGSSISAPTSIIGDANQLAFTASDWAGSDVIYLDGQTASSIADIDDSEKYNLHIEFRSKGLLPDGESNRFVHFSRKIAVGTGTAEQRESAASFAIGFKTSSQSCTNSVRGGPEAGTSTPPAN